MLIRRLRPWRPLVLVSVSNSCPPRILPRALPRAPVCTKRFSHDERHVKVSQASVLFQSSRHATPDNLIASIEPISPCSSIEGIEDSYEQAILLFTPTFAQALAYDPQFLSKVVNRLFKKLPDFYQHGPDAKVLHVAVAVVDRLPMPSRLPNGRRRPILSLTDHTRLVTDHGSEGLSYIVSAVPELGVISDTPALAPPNLDEIKTLSVFIGSAQGSWVLGMQGSETSTLPVDTQDSEAVKSHNVEVQIPLASTVFQAGQPNILSLSSWAWGQADGRYLLNQKSAESPSHVSFKCPFAQTAVITMALVPLTPPRKIVAGMGNVIRQIERDTEHITASQELEPAVSSYFIAKDLAPSAVNVWALVIPGDLYLEMESDIHAQKHFAWLRTGANGLSAQSLRELWQKELAFAPHRWFPLLRRGARLHRVLSGGGGWGEKAGLISLDPDSDFRKVPAAEIGAVFADNDLFETHEGMLGNAAKVGDLVQFYICPSNTTAHSPSLLSFDDTMRFEVGIIPSTIDTMPFSEDSKDGDGALPLGRVHHNLFGFMSEKGVSFAQLKLNADLTWSTSSRTKISVPFSRLLFIGRWRTNNLLFTSFQGETTPIRSIRLPSEPNKILSRRRAQNLVALRRQGALSDDFDYGSLIAGGPIITRDPVATADSPDKQSSLIRKVRPKRARGEKFALRARESTRAAWTLLRRRRARRDIAVERRSRYEEELETALVGKHFRTEPIVEETAEMKMKRKEVEEKEKEELLATVRELLKGF